MSDVMLIVVVVALVLLGYAPARLISGSSVFALLVAPMSAGLLLGITFTIGLALRLPAALSLLAAVIISAACAAVVLRRPPASTPDDQESRLPLLFAVVALIPVVALRRGPIEHDFRVIWSMHAKWITAGGAAMADAMRNHAFAFAHPDYPPLAPAAVGASRWLAGSDSLRMAQVVVALLTLSAVSTLAFSIWRVFQGWMPNLAAGVGGVSVLAVYGAASATSVLSTPGTNGYVDMLWAACFAAASVFLLVAPRGAASIRLGALCLAVAALTKNEGTTASVLLVAIVAVRYRRELGRVLWLVAALVPALAWILVVAGLGAMTTAVDAPGNSRLGELLRLDPDVTSRVGPTLRVLWHFSWPFVIVGALVTVLASVSVRRARVERSGSWFPWLWISWLATTTAIALAFVTTGADPPPLLSAPDRTSIAGNLVLLSEIVVWGGIALGSLIDGRRPAFSSPEARGGPGSRSEHRRAAPEAPW